MVVRVKTEILRGQNQHFWLEIKNKCVQHGATWCDSNSSQRTATVVCVLARVDPTSASTYLELAEQRRPRSLQPSRQERGSRRTCAPL